MNWEQLEAEIEEYGCVMLDSVNNLTDLAALALAGKRLADASERFNAAIDDPLARKRALRVEMIEALTAFRKAEENTNE